MIIGIPSPTSQDLAYNRLCWPQYAQAVETAGGRAVAFELGDLEVLGSGLAACDGFILPGSPADVTPESYGQGRHPATAPADPAREQCDREILAHADTTGKPVLAICFGMQLLNVWRGGSLMQDLPPLPTHHAAGAQVGVAHSVLVGGESLLAGLLTAQEAPLEASAGGSRRRLPVNSSHHQAVATAGEGLVVVARGAADGAIEALEGRIGQAAVLGVQWHPERTTAISAASRAIFVWLVAEAEDRRGSLTLAGVHDWGE